MSGGAHGISPTIIGKEKEQVIKTRDSLEELTEAGRPRLQIYSASPHNCADIYTFCGSLSERYIRNNVQIEGPLTRLRNQPNGNATLSCLRTINLDSLPAPSRIALSRPLIAP